MLHEVCRHLRAAGAHYRIAHANSLADDQRLARLAAKEDTVDAVIAAGGDSTVRGVAAGLVGSAMPLGIIPVGTGNVLAHETGIRRGPKTVAHYLMNAPTAPVTSGLANGEPFMLMASAGFDARVLARLETVWKRRMGKLAYVWPVLSELAARQQLFDVMVDGNRHQCSWMIVTKVKHYGGPFIVAHDQHLQSEHFHAALITAQTPLALLRIMITVAMGRAENTPDLTITPCRHVFIPGSQDVTTQLDGEASARPPLDIAMGHDPLQLIVPPHFEIRRAAPLHERQPQSEDEVRAIAR